MSGDAGARRALAARGVLPEHLGLCMHALAACGMASGAGDFTMLESGMTNTSYRFSFDGARYLLRVAGKGTEAIVDRAQEFEVYRLLEGAGIADRVVFLEEATGIKVAEFVEGARMCDPSNPRDVRRCMEHLRRFHDFASAQALGSPLIGDFDFMARLAECENAVVGDMPARFPDYCEVRAKAARAWAEIEASGPQRCLCHIDPVAANFLVRADDVLLVDWEYAAMADPHVDIAMFCIHAGYGRERIDEAVRLYVGGEPDGAVRARIYAYCALAGLLWTVWCEVRREAGGCAYDDYQKAQYAYARTFLDLARSVA